MVKGCGFIILLTTMCLNMSAQQLTNDGERSLKQFTLEDLNFGGKNYKTMNPQPLKLWWDGNTLKNSDETPPPVDYPQITTREHNIYLKKSEEAEE